MCKNVTADTKENWNHGGEKGLLVLEQILNIFSPYSVLSPLPR